MRSSLIVVLIAGLGLGATTSSPAQIRTRLRRIAPPAVTSGHYRVMILGARVDQETEDDFLERDGKRDEIYFAARVQQFDRRDQRTLADGVVRSGIMGDVNGFPARMRAGSASPQGGIRTGDNVPAVGDVAAYSAPPVAGGLPLLVWDGTLRDGIDVIVVQSDVWEWDGDPALYNSWVYWTSRLTAADPDVQRLTASRTLTLDGPRDFELGDLRAGVDRPIAVFKAGSSKARWNDHFLVLTREAIEAAIQNWSAVGGRPPVTLDRVQRGYVDKQDGVYHIYFRIERLP